MSITRVASCDSCGATSPSRADSWIYGDLPASWFRIRQPQASMGTKCIGDPLDGYHPDLCSLQCIAAWAEKEINALREPAPR